MISHWHQNYSDRHEENHRKSDLEAKTQFRQSDFVDEEGLYEVSLSWIDDRLPLSDNKDLTFEAARIWDTEFSFLNLIFGLWGSLVNSHKLAN